MFHNLFEKDSYAVCGGASEKLHSGTVKSPKSLHLLLRLVDDFILISTCRDTSLRFLKKIKHGIPNLGVKFNKDKTRVNYDCEVLKLPACNKSRDMFPWCGLLVNTRTCEITLDFDRFAGTLATDNVVIQRLGNEGRRLKKKMKDFVRPRCSQRLLFSSRVNRPETVHMNFYISILLCAIKSVFYIEQCCGVHSTKHINFIHAAACGTIKFAHYLITSSLRSEEHFDLNERDAMWLGKQAFFTVIKKKGRAFAQLNRLFSRSMPSPSERIELLNNATERATLLFPLDKIHY